MDVDQFSVIKYVTRHKLAGKGEIDAKKALHYLLMILRDDYKVCLEDTVQIVESFFGKEQNDSK